MNDFSERYGLFAVAIVALLIVVGAYFVSDGLFSIDEYMYLAATESLQAGGSLIINNGYERFGSESLTLWLGVVGPNGLVSQYPIGSSLLGAPFYSLFGGGKALIAVNALAGALTLLLTYLLGRNLFQDSRVGLLGVLILVFGSFWADYAYGIWPHSLSVMFVVGAVYCVVKAIQNDDRAFFWGVLGGVAIGAGILTRMDTVLALPALAIVVLICANRPWLVVLAGLLGLMPAIVINAFVNYFKFGSPNPLSYGSSGGGGTSLETHFTAAFAMSAVFLFILLWRYREELVRYRLSWLLYFPPVMVLSLLFLDEGVSLLNEYFVGFHGLIVDAGAIDEQRIGMQRGEDGILYFWGFVKKSLGQSLPWLGLLTWIFVRKWDGQRLPFTLTLSIISVWTLPFILLSWHGGLASNMRYFLPLLPVVSIVAAKLSLELIERTDGTSRAVMPGVLGGLLLVAGWSWFGKGGMAGAQQIMASYLFGIVCITGVLAGWRGRHSRNIAHGAQAVVAAAFVVSTIFSVLDFSNGQAHRAIMARSSEVLSKLPRPNMIMAMPEVLTFQIGRDDGLITLQDPKTGAIDASVLYQALTSDFRVFVPSHLAPVLLQKIPVFDVGDELYRYPLGELAELKLNE